MNRNTSILFVAVFLLCVGVAAYGSQFGFIVIDNEVDPITNTGTEPTTTNPTQTTLVDPTFSVVVKDTEGTTIDWEATDEIVSGTIKFEVSVTNAGSNVKEISDITLEVYEATSNNQIGTHKGTFVLTADDPQKEYSLFWDTTTVPDGVYILQVEYLLASDEGGGDDGGGYNVAFSMGLDTSESGIAGVNLLSLLKIDYTLPLILIILLGGVIVYLVLRFRR